MARKGQGKSEEKKKKEKEPQFVFALLMSSNISGKFQRQNWKPEIFYDYGRNVNPIISTQCIPPLFYFYG